MKLNKFLSQKIKNYCERHPGPVITIGSAEGKGLSTKVRQQVDAILPKYGELKVEAVWGETQEENWARRIEALEQNWALNPGSKEKDIAALQSDWDSVWK